MQYKDNVCNVQTDELDIWCLQHIPISFGTGATVSQVSWLQVTVSWLGIKGASLKGSVIHKHRWGKVHHFVKNCMGKWSNSTSYQHKNVRISTCTIHNIIKRFRESEEISACREHGWELNFECPWPLTPEWERISFSKCQKCLLSVSNSEHAPVRTSVEHVASIKFRLRV